MNIDLKTLRFLPYRLRKVLNVHVRVRFEGHELMIPVNIDDAFQNLSWSRSWRTELFQQFVDPNKGVFIDVGANIGQTLLDLLLTQPLSTYVGFEPNLACASYLNDFVGANALSGHRIISVGLSDGARVLPLYTFKGLPTDSGGTVVADLRPGREHDVQFVPCFKFDDIRGTLGLDRISFVKIDVEGAEFETIVGMEASLRKSKPLILCEILLTDSNGDLSQMREKNERLMRLLGGMGYGAWQLLKSADCAQVVNAKKIEELPNTFWTEENRHTCDYLFIPVGEEAQVLSKLVAGKNAKESRVAS